MAVALKIIAPPAVDETSLRAALANAIEERDHALLNRDRAAASVERAGQFLAELQKRVETFERLDRKVATERARDFKAALIEDEIPSLNPSAELTRSAAARIDAQNQIAAAQEALAALTAEREEAQADLRNHEAAVLAAAKKVVAARADRMTVELREVEVRASELRRRLLGVTALRQPSVGPYQLKPETMAALRDSPYNAVYTRNSGDDVQFWDRWLARLTQDADAEPEP